MPVKKVKEFLDSRGVKYVNIAHSRAYTAQEVAASAHISGNELAKTVIVKLDGKLAMVVLPASAKVDLSRLKAATGARAVEFAHEYEFKDAFPGCEVGAMPPFGNLYGMQVFLAKSLSRDADMVFNAGSHTELMKLAYSDYQRLVNPKVIEP
jgi:Ala-tRNA(Pro) deacylase